MLINWTCIFNFFIVQQLLENRSVLPPSHQMMADLQSLSAALLETVNDKNLAISHQRKTNKWVFKFTLIKQVPKHWLVN